MAPYKNIFPIIPFQAAANPQILLQSKASNKENEGYENENIEVIYVLRLCNAIFVLVCWKENKWSAEEELYITTLLPHSILRENSSSALVTRVTDPMNSGHLHLIVSKEVQKVHDFYLFTLMNFQKYH